MAQRAAQIRITWTAPNERSRARIFGRMGAAVTAAVRRSGDRRRLASTLDAAEVGRATGVRC